MKNLFLIFIILTQSCLLAQEKYKYAIVPLKFAFQKTENQYNLNNNCKSMLQSYNLITYLENEIPDNLDLCNALKLNVKENNSMLATKFTLELLDCKNKVVYISKEGISREKEYKKSFNEALRNASLTLKEFDFFKKNDFKNNTNIIVSEPKIEKVIVNEIKKPQIEAKIKDINTTEKTTYKLVENINGYELINNNKELILKLLKTSNPSIFIINDTNYQGIAYVTFNNCTIEYYKDNMLKKEIFNLN